MYEDSCEITDVDMGPCLRPAEYPAWAALQDQCQNKGLQQELAGKGVRRRTETAQEEEEGKGAKKSCYDPT